MSYTSREMRLIAERDAALARAEDAEAQVTALEKTIGDLVRRLDELHGLTDSSLALGVEGVTRQLAFAAGVKRKVAR